MFETKQHIEVDKSVEILGILVFLFSNIFSALGLQSKPGLSPARAQYHRRAAPYRTAIAKPNLSSAALEVIHQIRGQRQVFQQNLQSDTLGEEERG